MASVSQLVLRRSMGAELLFTQVIRGRRASKDHVFEKIDIIDAKLRGRGHQLCRGNLKWLFFYFGNGRQ